MKQILLEYLVDFSHLVFPFNCFACGIALNAGEKSICNACRNGMPLTKYWLHNDNPVEKLFWAKIPVKQAASFVFFTKGGMMQELIHQLKYKGKTAVGELMGELFAQHLCGTAYEEVDVIVPVPLHVSRQKKRGYNQCEHIANGMAAGLKKNCSPGIVQRVRANETQTRKGVYERWINVQELFRVERPELVAGKHVLLVDDVVTTGSTLEACAGALLQVPGTKVSITTLACPAPY